MQPKITLSMQKTILLLLVLIIASPLFGQKKLKKELDSITTTERAEEFIKNHKNRGNKIITFNEEKHKTRLAKEILKMGKGGSKVIKNEIENIHYKVIEKNKITYYRVSYIRLDGSKMSITDIDKLRPELISKIKRGVPFKDLALKYSMDANRKQGGDSGWITNGDMLPEFEAKVMNDTHNIEDVFEVNVESNKWYYVVQKTHDKKNITEVKVLKVVESKR